MRTYILISSFIIAMTINFKAFKEISTPGIIILVILAILWDVYDTFKGGKNEN